MKLLVCLSLCFGVVVCQLGHGAYNYDYSIGQISRSEMRFPNGTVSGRYNFVDEHNHNHEVVYTAGTNQGFQVLSHKVSGNGETMEVSTDYTPEVQSARDSHIAFQNYLRMVLPQITDDEPLPVYVRHVPSPVKEEPNVPIIPVIPPQNVIQQQVQEAAQVVANMPRKVFVVKDLPPHAQLGYARTLFVDDVQPHISVKVEEIPADYLPHPISAPHIHHVHHTQQPLRQVPQLVHRPVQYVQPQQVQQPVQPQIHYIQQVHPQPAPVHVVQQPVAPTPIHNVAHFVQQHQHQHQHHQGPTAQDVYLINGFTPEVARATQEHLSHVAAVKASLPITGQ